MTLTPKQYEGRKLKVLDLFSGIGGFSLGLERTGGFETVAFCEIEEFPRKVLAKHWPKVPILNDVRTVCDDMEGIDCPDVITAGFPCQDISLAGGGAGLSGKRSGLWWSVRRAIRLVRPKFALLENVAALLKRGMGTVLGGLATIRYDTEWHCIPASYVGARQLRDRVWIVAHPECDNVQGRTIIAEAWCEKSREEQLAGLVQPCAWPEISSARSRGTGHGIPNGSHRNRAIGNAVVPQIPELIGHAILRTSPPQIRDRLKGMKP
jgi:DNA (cytosine-5)-methyltransferase 1